MTNSSEAVALDSARDAIKEVVRRARLKFGGNTGLAAALEGVGVINRKEGKRYSDAAVTKWVTGESPPPPPVLLVIAQIGEVSVDELIFGQSGMQRQIDAINRNLAATNRRLDAMGAAATGAPIAPPFASDGMDDEQRVRTTPRGQTTRRR